MEAGAHVVWLQKFFKRFFAKEVCKTVQKSFREFKRPKTHKFLDLLTISVFFIFIFFTKISGFYCEKFHARSIFLLYGFFITFFSAAEENYDAQAYQRLAYLGEPDAKD